MEAKEAVEKLELAEKEAKEAVENLEKGIETGKIEGRQESQLEIAREMLKKGIEISLVAEITKLPLAMIKTLL